MSNAKKMIVLVGPPASGKSTWAKEFMKTHENTHVIVCRDSIRENTGIYWLKNDANNRNRESYITDVEHVAVESAISHGFIPIIDATNLNDKAKEYHKTIAERYGLEIEYKHFYVPFKEAVERDAERAKNGGHFCGKSVIKRFYQNYYKEQYEAETLKTVEHYRVESNKDLPTAIVCDIDGTLAWMQGRSPYDLTKVSNDKPDRQLIDVIRNHEKCGAKVIILSGREGTEDCRRDTEEWLKDNGVIYSHLFMRKKGDYRSDDIVKKELYEEYIKGKYNVLCVYDDRDKVVNMWREQGLLCCQVANGNF